MRWLALILLLLAPLSARAQDDDRGFLTGLIERNLSGPGSTVRLDGFQGALSSEASFDRLTISDDKGVWLTVENAKLDWSRSALLRGQLLVTELSAEVIDLERLPPSQGSGAGVTLPSPSSAIVNLPSLPVEVHIGRIATDSLRLGPGVLGEEIRATIEGKLDLADGAGAADIALERTDGRQGRLALAASFSNETRELAISLDLAEAEGGVLANMLGLPDRPALRFTIEGDAPISDFTADIRLDTAGEPRMTGTLSFNDLPDGGGLGYALALDGDVAPLFAEAYRPFFGTQTALKVAGQALSDGRQVISDLSIDSQELTLAGSLEIAADGVPARFDLDGRIAPSDGDSVLLPLSGVETRIGGAEIAATFDAADSDAFTLRTAFSGLMRDGMLVDSGALTAIGNIRRGEATGVTADVTLDVTGMDLASPDLSAALGRDVAGKLRVDWTSGGSLAITGADVTAGQARFTGDATFSGLGQNLRITTRSTLNAPDLAPYSALAGMDLGGAATATLDGWYEPLGRAFDLTLDASTRALDLGEGLTGKLANGDSTFAGRLARGPEGTSFDDLRIATPQVSGVLSGNLGPEAGDVTLDLRLDDVAVVYPALSGTATLKGTVGRQGDRLTLDVAGTGPGGVTLAVDGTALADLSVADVTIDGRIEDIAVLVPQFSGPVTAQGGVKLDGATMTLDLATQGPEDTALQVAGDYRLDTGIAALTVKGETDLAQANRFTNGAVVLGGRGVVDLIVAGKPALGALSGTVATRGGSVALPGAGITVPSADLVITLDSEHPTVPDALLAVAVEGVARDVQAPGAVWAPLVDGPVELKLAAALRPDGLLELRDMAVRNGDARIAGRADVAALYTAPVVDADLRLALDDLSRLEPVAKIALGGAAALKVSARYATADGAFSADLDGTTESLRVGQGAAFGLLGGDATLRARVEGTRDEVHVSGLDFRNPALAATGTVDLLDLTGETRVNTALNVSVASLVPLQALAGLPLRGGVTADVTASYVLPTGALDAAVEGRATDLYAGSGPAFEILAGDASFAARITGRDGQYRIEGGQFRNGALTVSADYAPGQLTLDGRLDNLGRFVPQFSGPVRVTGGVGIGDGYDLNLNVSGPGGISARVNGPISAAMVPNLSIDATAPLGVANLFLPDAVDLQGSLAANLTMTGSLGLEGLSGTVDVTGGRAAIPAVGMALTGLTARATLGGGSARIEAQTGFSTGGRATVGGTVGLTAPYAMDLAVALQDVGAVKEPTFRTTLTGQLQLAGSVMGGGSLTGAINLGETEISLAFSGAGGTLIDVTHVGEPADSRATRARAGVDGSGAAGSGGGGTGRLALDVTINAPNRVFIRGRGLDAELGGSLQITGYAGNVIPIGQFELIRGRLEILGRRLDLTEGFVTLEGTFDPTVRLVAATEAEDVSISIVTEGNATAPRVTLNSSPDLPDDEILALLLFGKGIDKISALQAIQLAAAVGTLIGPGGEGIQGKIRKQFGLDDLDLTTDADGNIGLRAGKYLSENVYSDVTVNAQGEAEIELNLDITPNLTGRGKLGTDGETSLGIFFEKDY